MKYTYHFANGESSEIEVSDEDAFALSELDRVEYNNNQRETRRHASLESFNMDDSLIPSNDNTEADVIRNLENEAVHIAMQHLLPQQKELIYRVYMERKTIASIARAECVNEAAIRGRLKKIYAKMKSTVLGGSVLPLP